MAAACSAEVVEPGLAERGVEDGDDPASSALASDAPASDDGADEGTDESTADGATPAEAELATSADADAVDRAALDAGTALIAPECADGDDRTVTHQPDVLVAPVDVAEQTFDGGTVGGETIPAATVAAVNVPGLIVDGGCVIEHDAPAGCLGAIDITGVSIPPVSIPAAELAEVVIGGEVIQEASSADGDDAEGSSVEAVRQDQVCSIERGDGDGPRTITRLTVSRPAVSRPAISRKAVSRQAVTIDGDFVAPAYVAPVFVPVVAVPVVVVPQKQLTAEEEQQGGLDVFDGEQSTTYFADADVLFDFGSAELQPAADEALTEVAASLNERHPSGPILIGGHTDSVGDEAANQALSEARAEAVADWLVGNGGVEAARLEVEGYGETIPIAPNETASGEDDPEGRRLNRRVVITTGDG